MGNVLAQVAPIVGLGAMLGKLLEVSGGAQKLADRLLRLLDAAATWKVLRTGAAASFMLDDRGDRMVHGADQVKSALVLEAARENSYPAPLASAAAQLYPAGRRAGFGRRDDSSMIDVLRGRPAA